MTIEEAIKAGSKRYDPPQKQRCKKHPEAQRYVSGNHPCCECIREYNNNPTRRACRISHRKKWEEENRESRREYEKAYRAKKRGETAELPVKQRDTSKPKEPQGAAKVVW